MAKKSSSSGGVLPFFLGLVVVLFLGWWGFPRLLFSAAEQPVRFSHLAHVDLTELGLSDEEIVKWEEKYPQNPGSACEDCHFFNDDGSFSGIPTNESCSSCHDPDSEPYGEDPEEKRYLEQYLAKDKEVPWLIYQYQPDNVYFSHAAHQDISCLTCHPNVGKTDTPPTHYRNILTDYSNGGYMIQFGRGANMEQAFAYDKDEMADKVTGEGYSRGTMKMWECEQCHAIKGQSNACFVCHR